MASKPVHPRDSDRRVPSLREIKREQSRRHQLRKLDDDMRDEASAQWRQQQETIFDPKERSE